MAKSGNDTFFKGPITSLEYLNDTNVIIGYGPYLSLIEESTFKERAKFLALKYRVIHKIIKSSHDPGLLCVFGQKSFNILRIDEKDQFSNAIPSPVELNDWIFDAHWYLPEQNCASLYLIIVLAHNQCVLFNLTTNKIEQTVYCEQKCMLYSALVLDFNEKTDAPRSLDNVLIASGTIYNQVLLWSAQSGVIYSKLDGHQGVIFNISFKNDYLFSVSDDRSINVWKMDIARNGQRTSINHSELYTRFYGHDARVWKCACFVQKSTGIGEDLNCCLWNLKDKSLVYRFRAMRKGSKNIWSLCVNEDKLEIITGWADGGLRKFELANYIDHSEALKATNLDKHILTTESSDVVEWNLDSVAEKDFIRDVLIFDERIVCCTNLGFLYAAETNVNVKASSEQKLLFKSSLLATYNVMAKQMVNGNCKHWRLAIGTLKGFVYTLEVKIGAELSKDEIKVDCINSFSVEEELKGVELSNAGCASKISSLHWYEHSCQNKRGYFLIASFGFMNGLIHVYELIVGQLVLVARLYLPECKHRWLTSCAVVATREIADSDSELIYLAVGDKCGNLYLYLANNKTDLDQMNETSLERQTRLKILEPHQSFKNLVKDKLPISFIYSKVLKQDHVYQVICCCKDGFYRLFELSLEDGQEDLEIETNKLKLVNKYQINSYVDLIEGLVFDEDLGTDCRDLDLDLESDFDLEANLRLALCFYGDKFMLWNFHLNRSLFEFKCGGANRSWDWQLYKSESGFLFRFIYLKDRSLCEFSKMLSEYEVKKPFDQAKNHFCQIFHGNTITVCKYLESSNCVLTGGEDTQLIVSSIGQSTDGTAPSLSLFHQFHLQGHDSVVRCLSYCDLKPNELLLVSAGGMANIKIWRLDLSADKSVAQVSRLYEFKRLRIKKENPDGSKVKPWLYVDLEKNPDIRFMDVVVFKSLTESGQFTLCFACSDGAIRLFNYNLETNRLFLTNKFSYNKCLLCIRHLTFGEDSLLLAFGTDGHLLLWKLSHNDSRGEESVDDELLLPEKIKVLHQSGINAVDMWRATGESNLVCFATVGDDCCISLLEVDLNSDFIAASSKRRVIRKDMAHASAISGVKFLTENTIVTAAKDQRLITWKIDRKENLIKPVNVKFINVADVSSMDAIKVDENAFRVTIVGVGIEIVDIIVD